MLTNEAIEVHLSYLRAAVEGRPRRLSRPTKIARPAMPCSPKKIRQANKL